MNRFGNIDSKFRFVILASKRAKQLIRGAKPKIKTKSRNPIRVAQTEVRAGVVDYKIIPTQKEEFVEQEDRVFVSEALHEEIAEPEDIAVGKGLIVPEVEVEEELEGKEEADEEIEEDEDAEVEAGEEDEKDE